MCKRRRAEQAGGRSSEGVGLTVYSIHLYHELVHRAIRGRPGPSNGSLVFPDGRQGNVWRGGDLDAEDADELRDRLPQGLKGPLQQPEKGCTGDYHIGIADEDLLEVRLGDGRHEVGVGGSSKASSQIRGGRVADEREAEGGDECEMQVLGVEVKTREQRADEDERWNSRPWSPCHVVIN